MDCRGHALLIARLERFAKRKGRSDQTAVVRRIRSTAPNVAKVAFQAKRANTAGTLPKHGEIGTGRNRGDDVTSVARENSAEYVSGKLLTGPADVFAALEGELHNTSV